AMENTTAVIFGEFMQQTERELIDNLTNDKIVAHEMFHHWFGDYVTCETWSQLTLNEGFANYSEYLWLERQFGRDEADSHLLEEWSGYLGSAQRGGVHPLIWTDYDDKEDMFDAHSYNKGGSVLHMLRYYVGDEAFFASLKKYLTDNKLSAVEVDELRMAFEEVTGQDLNWFFNQWFHQPGHPALDITYGYNRETREATVLVKQTQSTENGTPGVFQLPVDIDVYGAGGAATRHRVMVTEREQLFRFPAATEPPLIVFDAEHVILGPKDYNSNSAQLAAQFRRAPRFLDRYNALARISSLDGEDDLKEAIFNEALQDTFYGIRAMALARFEMGDNSPALARIRTLAREDAHSEVRSTALGVLAAAEDPMTVELAKSAVDNARSYTVVGAGLAALAVAAPAEAATYAKKLENEENGEISAAVATIYGETGDAAYLPYFQNRLEKQDGFGAMNFYGSYQELLAKSDPEQFTAGLAEMRRIGTDQAQSPWRRLASAKALADMRSEMSDEVRIARVNEVISAIVSAETNEDLIRIYPQFTGGK
ncbi:MAG: M1 family aminopeptidase, partial [Saprospiraceae bacterium]